MSPRANPEADLVEQLGRWVSYGLIAPEQAAAVVAYEHPSAVEAQPTLPEASVTQLRQRSGRVPVVAEALGYLGAILAAIGLVLLVGEYWPDMATWARLTSSGIGALALVGAGALVHEMADPALARLRGFLWLASSATTALFGVIVMVDVFDAQKDATIVLGSSAAVSASPALGLETVKPDPARSGRGITRGPGALRGCPCAGACESRTGARPRRSRRRARAW